MKNALTKAIFFDMDMRGVICEALNPVSLHTILFVCISKPPYLIKNALLLFRLLSNEFQIVIIYRRKFIHGSAALTC